MRPQLWRHGLTAILILCAANRCLAQTPGFSQTPPVLPVMTPAAACELPPYRKDELRYKGKTFADCEKLLLSEIDPSARLEHLKAMAVFSRHGMASEVMGAILYMMMEYDYSFLPRRHDFPWVPANKAEQPGELHVIAAAQEIVAEIPPGKVPVTHLRPWLVAKNRGACWFALIILGDGEFGEGGKLIPEVLELTKNQDPHLAADALDVLSCLSDGDPRVRQALLDGLKHQHRKVRQFALLHTFKHRDSEVRRCALQAVASCTDFCEDVDLAILWALEDRDPGVCLQAINAAVKAKLADKAIDQITKLLYRDDLAVQDAAIAYVESLGSRGREAATALRCLLETAHPQRQERIWGALEKIEDGDE